VIIVDIGFNGAQDLHDLFFTDIFEKVGFFGILFFEIVQLFTYDKIVYVDLVLG